MKALVSSAFPKAVVWLVSLVLWLGASAAARAGDKDPLFPGTVRPGNWGYEAKSQQGYLKVYSASDVIRNGDTRYFPHTSYVIYTIDGKLFKNVENHRSTDDEIPELVSLPVGSYTVVARSMKGRSVGTRVVIKEDQQTILHLDIWDTTVEMQLAHN